MGTTGAAESIGEIIARLRAPRRLTPEQIDAAYLAGEQSFLDALHDYPIDNRREGETFHQSFTRGETGKPNPPRTEWAKYRRGSKEAVVEQTMALLRSDYPLHLAEYGEAKARLEIVARLDQMEHARKNGWGLERKGGASKSEGWGFGGQS